jgi:hypothetical protein
VLGLCCFVLNIPEHGTSAPKHVGVSIIVMYCILLSAVVGGHIDWQVNKLNFSYKPVKNCILQSGRTEAEGV